MSCSFSNNIQKTSFFIKWISVLFLMFVINFSLDRTYGPLNGNFFHKKGEFVENHILKIYTLLVYSFIVGVREWDNAKGGCSIQNWKDSSVYIIIVLFSFIYSSSFIRRKFTKQSLRGGSNNGGLLNIAEKKIAGVQFNTIAIYTGILIILLNVFSNAYIYLKNKEQNKQDNMIRSIYFSQIAVIFVIAITGIFIFGLGWHKISGPTSVPNCPKFISKKGICAGGRGSIYLRWIIVLFILSTGVGVVSSQTEGNWFGE